MTLQYRNAFRARVHQLKNEQFGGNLEEALIAAIGDEFEARDSGALVVKKGALKLSDDEKEELQAGTAVVVEEAAAEARAAKAEAKPAKKRGRPRKVKA